MISATTHAVRKAMEAVERAKSEIRLAYLDVDAGTRDGVTLANVLRELDKPAVSLRVLLVQLEKRKEESNAARR